MKLLNCRYFIETFLKIRTKHGEIIPFKLNQPQERLYAVIREKWKAGKPVRIVILKARQMGFSTVTEGIIFFLTVTKRFTESMIVAHKEDATANLFKMSKRFYEFLPDEIRPMMQASNAQELYFNKPTREKTEAQGLGSRIRCATAGGNGIGRSYTLTCLHASEYAFWPGKKRDTLTGLVQAVPDEAQTLIVIESTANGFDEFKELWDASVEAERSGTDGYTPIFFAWYEMEEYRRKPRPNFERTKEEEELAAEFGLDDWQLAWRRWCIAEQCGGDINVFRQEYPATPDEAFISTGVCVFDKQQIWKRRMQVQNDVWECGRFVAYEYDGKTQYDPTSTGSMIASWKWQTEKNGPVKIRKQPTERVPYVIGGDTAGDGSDWFVGQVLDNRTGEQVAVLRHQFGEREYAVQMFCLGKYYNNALIGIETNYSTYPEKKIEELGYKNLYVRELPDNYEGKLKKAFGFATTPKTRPAIIDNLRDVAKYSMENISDFETLGEMLTFVYDENRKPQAEVGKHDDLVMALAIAHHIRTQQRVTQEAEPEAERNEWTTDMWEDYRSASAEMKQYLRQKWGEPK